MNRLKNNGNGFTMVGNGLLNDNNISFKAKGLYAYMASKPDGWQFYESQLSGASTEGRDAVRSALSELMDCGWLLRTSPERKDDGTYSKAEYEIVHRVGLSNADKPMRITRVGKPATSNTNNNNTDLAIKNKYPLTPKGECVVVCGFELFWNEWPKGSRKVNRKGCEKIWRANKLDEKEDAIILSLQRWKMSEDWRKDNGQYIPQPATWLNQERWEAVPKLSATAVLDHVDIEKITF